MEQVAAATAAKKSLSLSDLRKRKRTELPIPDLGGSLWIKPLRAGFVIEHMVSQKDGEEPDLSKQNQWLVDAILEAVQDEAGNSIFESREDVLSVDIETYNLIAQGILAIVNPKAAAELAKAKEEKEDETTGPSSNASPTGSPAN